jgi:uncharacterized protein
MNQPARAQEPSMEEILASIRRIIADDDASKAPAGELPPAEPPRPVPQAPPVQQHVQPPVQVAPPPPPPAPPPPAPPRIEQEPPPPVLEEPVAFQPETVAEQSADILDLTESMTTAPSAPPQFRTIDASSDLGFDEAQEPPPPPPAPFPPAPSRLEDHQERLLSNAAGAAVDSAFHALAQTVLSQNARTLEDLVRDMLRPMLKSWLDDNLPGMVERMVRAEIERVSRGRPG